MNAKSAKMIRRMARSEISGDQGVVDRELVIKRNGQVVNHPNSVRAMAKALKKRFNDVKWGQA